SPLLAMACFCSSARSRLAAPVLALALLCSSVARPESPLSADSESSSQFSAVDGLIRRAMAEKKIPGAVVLVGHNGRIVFRRAYGWRSLEPVREPMTLNTIFDL